MNTRPDEYKKHAGTSLTRNLTDSQKQAITFQERVRVYVHAESNFGTGKFKAQS